MRMLTIIGGVLMLLTGIFCFINPGQTFLAIAFVIGLVTVSYTHLTLPTSNHV